MKEHDRGAGDNADATQKALSDRTNKDIRREGAQQAADDNGSSNLIESPVKPGREADKPALQRHDFPDGGGSGGAEAFRRRD